ncbi:MAG: S-layer homology domain-containing protein [Clostridia bacterium]|nr:S-layer homology domain-containing protein [Clostridia bacterium]
MAKLRTLLIIAAALLWTNGCVFAATADLGAFDADDRAVVTGTADSGNKYVSAAVFASGLGAEDAEAMVPGALIYANQIMPDGNGAFSFPVNMKDCPTGEYEISVYQGGAEIMNRKFPYADNADSKIAIEGLNAAAAIGVDAVKSYIAANMTALEFSSDYDGKADLSAAAVLIKNRAPFDTNDKSACSLVYKKAMLAAAFAGNMITDFEAAGADMLKESPIKEIWASAWLTESARSALPGKIYGLGGFETFEEFDAAVKDGFILSVTLYPTGSGDVASVIRAVYPGYPSEYLTAQCCRSVAYRDFKTFADLEAALKAAAGGSSVGSGGGGGGGSSAGSSKPPFTAVSDGKALSPGTSSGDTLPAPKRGFNDIEAVPWAAAAIEALSEKGIVSGRGDNMFCPRENVTREEFVKLLVMLFRLPADDVPEHKFTDADSGAWYYPYLNAAYLAGIISGKTDGSFGVGEPVTRQDAAVMLNNCISAYSLPDSSAAEFTDNENISEYAREAVKKIKAAGIISGYEDGSFLPLNPITRAEAAKILFETDERIEAI